MFSFLFNPTTYIVLFSIIILLGVAFLCFKFELARWITLFVVTFVLLGTSIYSGIMLNKYYSAEGGIRGYIDQLLHDKNKVEIDDKKFPLNNIYFSASSNENEYYVSFAEDKVIEIDDSQDYGVFVNGIPCANMQVTKSYASADFTQNFYGEDHNVILNDTLTIRIAFNTKSTSISLKTTGGSEAVKYWSNYFNKNNVVIEIVPFDYVVDSEIDYSDEDIQITYVTAKYYYTNGVEIATQVYRVGDKVDFIEYESTDDLIFLGWSLDKEAIVRGLFFLSFMIITILIT